MDDDNMVTIELSGDINNLVEALLFLAENPDWITEEDGMTFADLVSEPDYPVQ